MSTKVKYHAFTEHVPVVFVEDAALFISGLGLQPIKEETVTPSFMHEVTIGGVRMLVFSEALIRTLFGNVHEYVIESHLALWQGMQKYPQNEVAAYRHALSLAQRYNCTEAHDILRKKLADKHGITVEALGVPKSLRDSKADKRRKIEAELFTEVANTVAADVNEILLGFYALGGSWSGFEKSGDAKDQLDKRKAQLDATKFVDETERAKVMADAAISWAKSNGYSGNVSKVWWTARSGVLSQAVGAAVDSKKNPTDTLLQFSDGKFLGVSAKSTKSSGDIGFKNPGLGTIEKSLGVAFSNIVTDQVQAAIKKFDLPASADARKKAIRADSKIQKQTTAMGIDVLNALRDELYKKLSSLSQDALKDHLLSQWMDANIVYPPYIKVTGRGSGGKYTASVTDPLKNEKLKALGRDDISLAKVGNDSIGVMAGKTKIMKMRFKFESEKLASSVKLSGDPW